MCLLFFIFLPFTTLFARHINLDTIYIKKGSNIYRDIQNLKMNAYEIAQGIKADSGVIFAGWTSGNRVVYIKEYANSNTNTIYEYFPASRKKNKIYSIDGAIIYTRLSLNGHYLILKTLKFYSNESFKNEIIILNLRKHQIHRRPSSTVFTDFTVSHFGDLIFYETDQGIVQYNPEYKKERLYIPRSRYSSYFSKKNVTLAIVSPYEDKVLLLNGGGGTYKARLLFKGQDTSVTGITSASETFWVNNNSFIYRTGYIGNFKIRLYDAINKTSNNLSLKSYNTNITVSPYDNYISFLQDGMVSFYYRRTHYLKLLPIEGEDVVFSPSGNNFCSLFDGNLYIAKYSNILKKRIELRRNAKEILSKYKTAVSKEHDLANSYSMSYVQRKIEVYKKILQ